jgi:hypothetical protein
MPLAEKGVRGKGRQLLSPPQHTVTRSAYSAPNLGDLGCSTLRHFFDLVNLADSISCRCLADKRVPYQIPATMGNGGIEGMVLC